MSCLLLTILPLSLLPVEVVHSSSLFESHPPSYWEKRAVGLEVDPKVSNSEMSKDPSSKRLLAEIFYKKFKELQLL